MNPRIRELAEQAGITTNLDTDYFEKDMNKWVDYFAEQFAELIIKECALALDETIAPTSHPFNSIGWRLTAHFGVEE